MPSQADYGSIGGLISWGNTKNRTARTQPARDKFEQRFLDEADGDPIRAAAYRKAYFRQLALASSKARARRKKAS